MAKKASVRMLAFVVVFAFGIYLGYMQYDTITYIRSSG